MKYIFYSILCVLLINNCRQKPSHVNAPVTQQGAGPASLMKQHADLIEKAGLLAAGKDSTAMELYEILKYHFNEEEQYVFPVLKILPELAAGNIEKSRRDSIANLVRKFQLNSGKLLAEHQMIMAIMTELKTSIEKQNAAAFQEFGKALEEHAQLEEEILFPASVVIGDYLRLQPDAVRK